MPDFPVISPDDREDITTPAGGATALTIPFYFQRNADIEVAKELTPGAGNWSVLTEVTHYTITPTGTAPNYTGGTVTLVTPASGSQRYRVRGKAAIDRLTSVVRLGKFDAVGIDAEIARNRIIAQELRRDVDSFDAAIDALAAAVHVDSFIGRTGAVVAVSGDYNATKITNDSGVAGAAVKDALNALNAGKQAALGYTPENPANKAAPGGYPSLDGTGKIPIAQLPAGASLPPGGGGVDSFIGRTGNVVATAGDYPASKITNDSGVSGSTSKDALDTLNSSKQAASSELTALAGLASTGIPARTGSGAYSVRTLTAPAAGLGITNPGGVAGNPTFALANDLAALEALAATGIAVRTGSDAWTQRSVAAGAGIVVTNGDGVSGNISVAVDLGKQSIFLPKGAWKSRTTNGPSSGTIELTTNKNIIDSWDFDQGTQEFISCRIRMPKSWNEGTVSFIPVWSHPATATNFGVVWGMDAVAVHDNGATDVAFGTAQTSTDTGGTTNNKYEGPESSAITIAGSPAAGDEVEFRIHRDPANGSDTMAVDARLHGAILLITVDTTKDD